MIFWIYRILCLFLVVKNYNVYFYLIDGIFGFVKEEEIINNINDFRNFLIVFLFDYIDEDENIIWINIEWKYVWNLFKEESYV